MDEIDFTNQVVIVTGASSGIGAEAARLFAEKKAKLTIVGRNNARLNEVAFECESKHGFKPLVLQIDLTHPGSCEKVINSAVETFGRIDVLVNCAGKVELSCIFDQSTEVFDDMMNINLRVPYFLTHLAIPHLKRTKGNIINIGYSMMKRYKPGFLHHNLSKCALECFTQLAAPELTSEGVRINMISPGVVRTNILKSLNLSHRCEKYVYQTIAEMLPNRTIMEPKEVAILICLVASNSFPNMNGSNIVMDGGASTA